MAYLDLPDLSRDNLVELGGWAVYREGRDLAEGKAVSRFSWEHPVLSGEVRIAGQSFFPRLNLRSITFAENQCSCPAGRQGRVCSHAIALCLTVQKASQESLLPPEEPARTDAEAAPTQPLLCSLQVTDGNGKPLHFRVLLPPNLESAAQRNLIMVKVEAQVGTERLAPERIFRGQAYRVDLPHRLVGGLIESWCGGRLHGLLQLKRDQARQLLAPLVGHPCVFWVSQPDQPLPWDGERIPALQGWLADPAPAPPSPIPSRAVRPSAVDQQREKRHRHGPLTRAEVDGSSHYLAIRLPSREDPLHQRWLDLLKAHDFKLEPSNRRWWMRDRHKVLNFLALHGSELESTLGACLSENFLRHRGTWQEVKLVVEAQSSSNQDTLHLRLDGDALPPEGLRRALAAGQNYLVTPDRIFLIDPRTVERASRIQRTLSGDPDRILTPSFSQTIRPESLADATRVLEHELPETEALPENWRARSQALNSVSALSPAPVEEVLDHQLRGYQRIGVAWLWHLWRNQLGGVLADEMGLGKTIQALALATAVAKAGKPGEEEEPPGPILVVCPAGLVENWARESLRFAPRLQVAVHHRDRRLQSPEDFGHCHLVITPYQTLTRDLSLFQETRFRLIIADEAQHIKNRRTQAAQALRTLRAHARIVLTGTPVENSLDDLRSLFAFILPGYLARLPAECTKEDRAWFDQRHRAQAAPYILRRTKQLVAPELPARIEQVLPCELGERQRSLYESHRIEVRRAIFEMEMAGASEARLRLAALTELLRLRQICADPRLLDDSLEASDSAKLEMLLELLDEAVDDGHRALVFSQFVSVLDLLQPTLEKRGFATLRIDGSTRDRAAVAQRFNQDPDIPVCLISLKAGGIGLNLTGADLVVHYDPWWNPAIEAQATDRAHRIGQLRTVTSYKLIASGTVEEHVVALQQSKAQILRDLLDESAAATSQVSLAEIKRLLEEGPATGGALPPTSSPIPQRPAPPLL